MIVTYFQGSERDFTMELKGPMPYLLASALSSALVSLIFEDHHVYKQLKFITFEEKEGRGVFRFLFH